MATERKPNVLLVLFDGLPGTVIESQVLLHAREYAERGVADFEIWLVACFDDLYRRTLDQHGVAEKLAGTRVRVTRGIRPAIPFSGLLNTWRLWRVLRKSDQHFSHVHGRGDHGGMVAGLLARSIGAIAIWDCRGDSRAEFLERPRRRSVVMEVAAALRSITMGLTCRLAARLCHRAIFVSRPLRDRMQHLLGSKPSEVIPCAASEKLFFFDPTLRAETRRRLGFAGHHRVFIYSGSMAHYQCFPETVALFEKIHENDPDARLLVVTPGEESARGQLQKLPPEHFVLTSASIDEMNAYLNAADIAFMLREHNRTNVVASPTKFAEYSLTGLPVIMTDAVPDSYELAKRTGNLIAYANGRLAAMPTVDRRQVMNAYRPLLTKSGYVEAYRRVYAPS